MISSKTTLLTAAIAGCVMLTPLGAQAQWWSRAPADFEDCADRAEKAASKEAKSAALTECNAKFAGRRKPGGGYSYFDFMQNRHFDIAGPNPTPAEQKHIDEQYIVYLDNERRSTIAAAFTAKQQRVEQVALKTDGEKVPVPPARPKITDKPTDKAVDKTAAVNDWRPRMKEPNCRKNSFSCEWPRLSEGLQDFKKLFGSSQAKAKRS